MTLAHDQTWYRPIATPRSSWWPSALILSMVFISFRPFSTSSENLLVVQSSGGDIVNQMGFGLLGLICAYLLARKTCSNAVNALLHPLWILFLPVLILAVFNADDPQAATRAMGFSIIVVLAAASALSLPRNLSDLVSVLTMVSSVTLALCYIAVFAFPEQGLHDGSGLEGAHAGLWRGIYDHKNIASYVVGSFAIFGFFVGRNGKPLMGLLIFAIALFFVIQAGSKTVLGILPAAIFTAMLAQWVSWRPLKVMVLLLPVVALTIVTLGSVLYPPILEELQFHIPGLTYTGRTDIWIFGLNSVAEAPWFGYGFESFWSTPRVGNMVQPIDLNWDVRGIVHGHNSWLDATLAFGIPGTAMLLAVLVVLPLIDYCRIANSGNAGKLAGLFITIWVFTLLGASLESFFFRRADPVWFCLLIAIVGLRLTAHMSNQHIRAPMGR
ncbi:MAG: O-antigen ligase [Rhizobiaceae bacterium]